MITPLVFFAFGFMAACRWKHWQMLRDIDATCALGHDDTVNDDDPVAEALEPSQIRRGGKIETTVVRAAQAVEIAEARIALESGAELLAINADGVECLVSLRGGMEEVG